MRGHPSVKHAIGEFVDGMAHTNGIESFRPMLKRGYHGAYHKMSKKHLQRYVNEFAGRHNLRPMDTLEQMKKPACEMAGRKLKYKELIQGQFLASILPAKQSSKAHTIGPPAEYKTASSEAGIGGKLTFHFELCLATGPVFRPLVYPRFWSPSVLWRGRVCHSVCRNQFACCMGA